MGADPAAGHRGGGHEGGTVVAGGASVGHEPSYLSAGQTHANRQPEGILPKVSPTSSAELTECIAQINKEFVL